MALKVIFTDEVKEDLQRVIEYLKSEWSQKIADEFVEIFFSKVDILSKLPEIGIASLKDKRFRKILITKHNSLYYTVDRNKIVLLNLFDTRQNPKRNLYQ